MPVKFEKVKTFGILSKAKKNQVEFSKVVWGRTLCYDLRRWEIETGTPLKGITFKEEELPLILNSLKSFMKTKEFIPIREILLKGEKTGRKVILYKEYLEFSKNDYKNEIKKVTLCDWGMGPKLDFRIWYSSDEELPGRGISLTTEEVEEFYEILSKMLQKESEIVIIDSPIKNEEDPISSLFL